MYAKMFVVTALIVAN